MSYGIEIKPSCRNSIRKLCKKNPLLGGILQKKMEEVIQNPHHYKPLRHDLAGEKRVHVMKSLVLKFEVDETKKEWCSSSLGTMMKYTEDSIWKEK